MKIATVFTVAFFIVITMDSNIFKGKEYKKCHYFYTLVLLGYKNMTDLFGDVKIQQKFM